MARRKRGRNLTSEWIAAWNPTKQADVKDGRVRGLFLRGGPGGAKTFFRWTGPAGARKRETLGRWSLEGGPGTITLGEARTLVAKQTKAQAAEEGVGLTVAQVAEAYRRDVLSQRERADEAWNIVRVHVVEAQPDPKRPAFGEWPARVVRPADVATVVRYAKEPRKVESRRLGGPGVARVVLREIKALFAHAVETGSLDMTPAGVMRAPAFGLRATSRTRTLDADEIKALFAALDLSALLDGTAKDRRLSATVRLALAFQLYVPLRSQSIIGARWEEFDLDAARWTVPVERLKLKKKERAEARPFVVPLPPTAVAILRRLRELAGKSPWVLTSPMPPANKDEPPEHVESKALIRALTRLQDTGRLAFGSRLTVHDLRRTWRTFAMDLGVDHVVAERSMGHVAALRAAGFGGAADVYGRAQMVPQRAQAADLVAAAFDRIRLGEAATVVPLAERARG